MPHKLVLFLLVSLSNLAIAADDMRPASFDHPEKERRLAANFRWPASVTGKTSLTLMCFSVVTNSGKLKNTGCFSKNSFEQAFTVEIARAAKKTRMNAAVVGGKPQEVYMQYRVRLESDAVKKIAIRKTKDGEEEMSKKEKREAKKKAEAEAIAKANRRITLIPNPGYEENVEAYGHGHIAGQRVIHKKEPWYEACPKRARFAVWARAYLGADGKAESVSLEHADGVLPTAACQDAIKQTILASEFTPAIADGEPVPSTFIEMFGN